MTSELIWPKKRYMKIKFKKDSSMKEKKLSLFTLCLLLLMLPSLYAKYSDEFPYGIYANLRNGDKVDYPSRYATINLMKTLGYNATIMGTQKGDPDLPGLLKDLDNSQIDAWVLDWGWDKDPESDLHYASYPLSASSYFRFEAEFSSEKDVRIGDGMDNQYWYAAQSEKNLYRTGKEDMAPDASYGYVWKAEKEKDQPGHIFTDLRYRWQNRNGFYVRFGSEFLLYQTNPPDYPDDYIWVKFRFRISNLQPGISSNTPLLRFYVTGFELYGTGFSSQMKILNHWIDNQQRSETIFTVHDYLLNRKGNEFLELELKIPYKDLIDANLLTADVDHNPATPDSREFLRLVNLNPRVYWYGNCDVELDYVEIEDELHHKISHDKNYWQDKILQRMYNVISQGEGNVKGFYTFDEPYQGQFDSFKLMQEIASQEDIPVFTAVYDFQVTNITLNKEQGIYYDHIDAFSKIAQPQIIAPDIYPLKPDLIWNAPEGEKGKFIQYILDQKLLSVYQDCMEYRDKKEGRKFYPIVQVLGKWTLYQGQEQWVDWIQPTTAAQKVLLYLPLCFKPDGIFHYCLRSYQDIKGYGQRSIAFSRVGMPDYPLLVPDPITWKAVSLSNPRIKAYGVIIRDLNWQNSECIGTSRKKFKKAEKDNPIQYIQVQKQGIGEYEGYIQCTTYLDKEENLWLMIVNRRANFFLPGIITEPQFVPPEEFDIYFPEAPPQKLLLTFKDSGRKNPYQNYAFYDPYDNKFYPYHNGNIEIELPAGEGRLLKLVNRTSNDR